MSFSGCKKRLGPNSHDEQRRHRSRSRTKPSYVLSLTHSLSLASNFRTAFTLRLSSTVCLWLDVTIYLSIIVLLRALHSGSASTLFGSDLVQTQYHTRLNPTRSDTTFVIVVQKNMSDRHENQISSHPQPPHVSY